MKSPCETPLIRTVGARILNLFVSNAKGKARTPISAEPICSNSVEDVPFAI